MLTHADRLERWLGAEQVAAISRATQDFYADVPIANVPGRVVANRGDFHGEIEAGAFANLTDVVLSRPDYRRKAALAYEREARQIEFLSRSQEQIQATGFASLADLISEATTGGKRQDVWINKIGTAGIVGRASTLWRVGSMPAGGAAGAALAAGTLHTSANTGAIGPQTDPGGTDSLHITTMTFMPTVAGNLLILYDRLWSGAPVMATLTAQTITHTLARYASLGAGAAGNFAFVEVLTALAATPHNITLQYQDENANAAENAPLLAGIASASQDTTDHAGWFIPLNAPDAGFTKLTQWTHSANPTGPFQPVAGHRLCFVPQPMANFGILMDGINSAFNLVQVLTGACLSLLELKGAAVTATTYTGQITLVSG